MGNEPFLAQLMCAAFTFPPKGWALCNGALLAINQNQALFSLLGTVFGGNGTTNFALPNLQGRAAVHTGDGITLGQLGGEEHHTLTTSEMPAHAHPFRGTSANAGTTSPANHYLGNTTGALTIYGTAANMVAMAPGVVTSVGGSQPHPNQSPYLVMNWVIALQGIFPSQN